MNLFKNIFIFVNDVREVLTILVFIRIIVVVIASFWIIGVVLIFMTDNIS